MDGNGIETLGVHFCKNVVPQDNSEEEQGTCLSDAKLNVKRRNELSYLSSTFVLKSVFHFPIKTLEDVKRFISLLHKNILRAYPQ